MYHPASLMTASIYSWFLSSTFFNIGREFSKSSTITSFDGDTSYSLSIFDDGTRRQTETNNCVRYFVVFCFLALDTQQTVARRAHSWLPHAHTRRAFQKCSHFLSYSPFPLIHLPRPTLTWLRLTPNLLQRPCLSTKPTCCMSPGSPWPKRCTPSSATCWPASTKRAPCASV